MADVRFRICGYGYYNGRATYQEALQYASQCVRQQWRDTGSVAESFALIYDKLNRTRTIVWLNGELKIKYRKLY